MIIVDMNQVMIANFMMQIGNHKNLEIEESLVRHMVLNSLRSYIQKFGQQYGEMVIACDDTNYWRKKLFPYYKASRKKNRDKSEIDWNTLFNSLNKIRDEIRDNFPYRVIKVESAEADDVIGTLVHQFGKQISSKTRDILILSADKDFIQLHEYSNVDQYDPTRKKFIRKPDCVAFTKELIMRGDASDGIPNFLSPDDSFVLGKRQKPITTKKLEEWIKLEPEVFCNSEMLRNFKRNEQLIDLHYIPDDIKTKVMEQYNAQEAKGRDKLFNYFISNKLKHLMESISEF